MLNTWQSKDPSAYLVEKWNLRRGVSSTGVSNAQVDSGQIVRPGIRLHLGVSLNTFFCSPYSLLISINRHHLGWSKDGPRSSFRNTQLHREHLLPWRLLFNIHIRTDHSHPLLSRRKGLEFSMSSQLYQPLLLVRAVFIVIFSPS